MINMPWLPPIEESPAAICDPATSGRVSHKIICLWVGVILWFFVCSYLNSYESYSTFFNQNCHDMRGYLGFAGLFLPVHYYLARKKVHVLVAVLVANMTAGTICLAEEQLIHLFLLRGW